MDWTWAVRGVTQEIPRNAGLECLNYMTNRRRTIESIFVTILCIMVMRWAYKRMDYIELPSKPHRPHSIMRLFLLILMSFIFGVEFGFKLARESVIFVLNPCHVQTIVQVYLLAAKPSKLSITLFRIQMNFLNGPFLASLFPEIENRTYAFQKCTFWIQHGLLYFIPVYILRSGAYKSEKLMDLNWAALSMAINLLYHFNFLAPMSVLTGVNLNHMLCAAIADPFQGENYRVYAVIHQSILCPLLNKLTYLMFAKSDEKIAYLKK